MANVQISNARTGAGRACIIGAGACGLAVAKTFVARGIAFDLLEREADIGGLWNSATSAGLVYEGTHLVSSRDSTGFTDFPMPFESYPDYPSHERVIEYFRDVVRAFGIGPHIRYNTAVERVTQRDDGAFDVSIAGEPAPRLYEHVVVASGHHEKTRQPSYPGTFAGETIHSKDYRSPKQVRDKRVMVVGAGNSACDIIRDAVHASGAKVVMSMRRPTWFVPKFVLGYPTHDVVANIEWVLTPLPRVVKRWVHQLGLYIFQGPPWRYYLPQPAHWLDQTHPTMCDDIPRLAAHGRLIVRPQIARFEGSQVVFVDGTRETIDMIVYATGYELSIPFLDHALYRGADGRPPLYLFTAHPEQKGLFFGGLVQANGSIWRLADAQGHVIANTIVAEREAPDDYAEFYARAARAGAASMRREGFVASERHTLEANYYDYARALKREARRFRRARKIRLVPKEAEPRSRPVAAE